MMMKHGRVWVLAVSLGLFGGLAAATPVTWSLSNVVLSDGTTITGTFVFDADLAPLSAAFSGLNLTTSGGTTVPATSNWWFNTVNPAGLQNMAGFALFQAVDRAGGDLTGAHSIVLGGSITTPLTNSGGVLTLNFFTAATCSDAACVAIRSTAPSVGRGSGSFVSVANQAPEPSSLALAGLGLWIAIGRRRALRGRSGAA